MFETLSVFVRDIILSFLGVLCLYQEGGRGGGRGGVDSKNK